jgi:hypothetical protein
MRITLLLIVCFAVAALSQPAEAQQAKKVPRIGFLRPGPPSEDIIGHSDRALASLAIY